MTRPEPVFFCAFGRRFLAVIFGGFALLLAACKTTTGAVDKQFVLPPGAAQYRVREDQIFLAPDTLGDPPLPAYPAPLLEQHLAPVAVCVDVVVSAEGRATGLAQHTGIPGCPDADDPALAPFVQASMEAIQQWTFLAAAICTFPPGMPSDDRCAGEGVVEQPVAVRLTYRFEFSQHAGRGRVRRGTPEAAVPAAP